MSDALGDLFDPLAEMSLVGAVLVDNQVWFQIHRLLDEGHFADPLLGAIYGELGRRIATGGPVDMMDLGAWLDHLPRYKLPALRWRRRSGNSTQGSAFLMRLNRVPALDPRNAASRVLRTYAARGEGMNE